VHQLQHDTAAIKKAQQMRPAINPIGMLPLLLERYEQAMKASEPPSKPAGEQSKPAASNKKQ